jgi:tyrosyl-tRNA synthetase
MRISDDQLAEWYRLVMEQPVPAVDPLEAKLGLARFIVRRSWGDDGARAAEEHFTRVVRDGGAPEEVPAVALPAGDPVHLPKLLADHGLAGSTSEARRLIGQGGVKINGEKVTDTKAELSAGEYLLQVGKLKAAKLKVS